MILNFQLPSVALPCKVVMNPFSEYVKASEFSFCSASPGHIVLSSRGSDNPPLQTLHASGAIARSKSKQKSRNVAASGTSAQHSPGDTAALATLVSDVQLASGGGAVAAPAGAIARGKSKQKSRNVAASGTSAQHSPGDTAALATLVSDVQLASGVGAVAAPAGAIARSKSKQKKPKSSMSEAGAVIGVHVFTQGGAVLTAFAGNKNTQKLHPSAFDSLQGDELTSQLHNYRDLAVDQRQKCGTRLSARGTALPAFSLEGLHDNCHDAAFGMFPNVALFLYTNFI